MRRLAWISGAALAVILGLPVWSYAGALPQPLSLKKTVGLDPAVCADASGISVTKGTNVYYCYTITNNDVVSYTMHSLEDSVLGTINLPNGGDFFLVPQESRSVIAPSFQINASVINVATWMAVPTTGTVSGTATAQVGAATAVTANATAAVSIDPKAAPALGEAALAFVAAGLLAFGAIRLSRKLRDPS